MPVAFEALFEILALDARLGAAGVQFLTGAQACEVLKDGDGRVSGVVFADKSGRQAVRAKVVVDATEKGVVARKVASLRPVEDGNMVDFSLRMIAKSGLSFDLSGYAVEESAATSSTVSLYTGGDSSMVPSGAETSYAASMYTFTKGFRLTTDDWMDVNAIVQRMKTETWTASA
ncbi:MAG: FAD-dependent oxidoreductase, partial [Kiritimatiellae bacterium]|nr:FAD-dependent oxidoreductase [Kiritimatiellia bacterium]